MAGKVKIPRLEATNNEKRPKTQTQPLRAQHVGGYFYYNKPKGSDGGRPSFSGSNSRAKVRKRRMKIAEKKKHMAFYSTLFCAITVGTAEFSPPCLLLSQQQQHRLTTAATALQMLSSTALLLQIMTSKTALEIVSNYAR